MLFGESRVSEKTFEMRAVAATSRCSKSKITKREMRETGGGRE